MVQTIMMRPLFLDGHYNNHHHASRMRSSSTSSLDSQFSVGEPLKQGEQPHHHVDDHHQIEDETNPAMTVTATTTSKKRVTFAEEVTMIEADEQPFTIDEMDAYFYSRRELMQFKEECLLIVIIYSNKKKNASWDDDLCSIRGLEDALHPEAAATASNPLRKIHVRNVLEEQRRLQHDEGRRVYDAYNLLHDVSYQSSLNRVQESQRLGQIDAAYVDQHIRTQPQVTTTLSKRPSFADQFIHNLFGWF